MVQWLGMIRATGVEIQRQMEITKPGTLILGHKLILGLIVIKH